MKTTIKIPAGWRRLRVGAKRPANYMWWWDDAFCIGHRSNTGTIITRKDMNENGPYIARINKPAKKGRGKK